MFLNGAFVLFSMSLLISAFKLLFEKHEYSSWNISEFLINYQGGFVRRGLFGELLFFFAKSFNVNVVWTIQAISFLCFVFLCFFFVKCFLKKGYTLYILPLCFFLGAIIISGDLMRKDCLMICFLILILHVFNRNNIPLIIRIIFINILAVFILLTHEVFVFFSLPILFLLLLNAFKSKGWQQSMIFSFISLLPLIIVFFLSISVHGNYEKMQAIWDSWASLSNIGMGKAPAGAIEALSWSSKSAFDYHFRYNFLFSDATIWSFWVWFFTFPAIYYIIINALLVFRKREGDYTNEHRDVLGTILIFQFLCLLPVFTVLSCDYIRIIFYWTAGSFVIFLLFPIKKIKSLFPNTFVKQVGRMNNRLSALVYPTKTLIAFCMMFIAVSDFGFFVIRAVYSTMWFNILKLISRPFLMLFNIH